MEEPDWEEPVSERGSGWQRERTELRPVIEQRKLQSSCTSGCGFRKPFWRLLGGTGDTGLCVSSTSDSRHGCATWFKRSWAVRLCWRGLRVLVRCLALLDEHQQPATVNPQAPPAKSARRCLLSPEPFPLAVPCACSSPQKSPPALPVSVQLWAVCVYEPSPDLPYQVRMGREIRFGLGSRVLQLVWFFF